MWRARVYHRHDAVCAPMLQVGNLKLVYTKSPGPGRRRDLEALIYDLRLIIYY